MIRSMTGFGHGEFQSEGRKFTVEIKAVNHRYLDLNMKMPRMLNQFEQSVRNVLKEYVQRGKVDVYVTCENFSQEQMVLHYNEGIAQQYVDSFRKMAEQFFLDNDMRCSVLARCPEVLTLESGDEDAEEMWEELASALRQACEAFVAARSREGELLRSDLLAKLDWMYGEVTKVEERYPAILETYTEKLRTKMHELLEDKQIDETRLATELVIFSDKICTDEETVRLKSHISTMSAALKEGGFIGRRLDFIAQEMNREANTILSKSNDLDTSNLAVGLKTEIEKVREQIQNIE